MTTYRITRHAVERYRERVGAASNREAREAIERSLVGKRPKRRLPKWAAYRPESGVHLSGIVVVSAWKSDRLRPGWVREVQVGFPVVERDGEYVIVTTLIKRGDRLRLASAVV